MPNATDTELYRNYRVENSSAAVPTGPGGVPMLPLNLAQARSMQAPSPTNEKKGGWKRMFGAGRKSKGGSADARMAARDEEPKKSARAKMWRKKEREGINGDARMENGHVRGMSGGSGRRAMDGEMERYKAMGGAGGPGESFMGVGNDGVWISRKNFLKT